MGRVEESLAILAEALVAVEHDGIWFYAAELYRLKGELLNAARGKQKERPKTQKKVRAASSLQPLAFDLPRSAEAEECFLKAIDIARQQQAKSLELRAVMSLMRLRQQQAARSGAGSTEQGGRSRELRAKREEQEFRNTPHSARSALAEAHQMLSEVYHWFTEGFDTKDLQEAKGLLEELHEQTIG